MRAIPCISPKLTEIQGGWSELTFGIASQLPSGNRAGCSEHVSLKSACSYAAGVNLVGLFIKKHLHVNGRVTCAGGPASTMIMTRLDLADGGDGDVSGDRGDRGDRAGGDGDGDDTRVHHP